MSAENFINWYAAKTNSEFIEAKNKLFTIRSGSPKLYEFLIDKFQGQGTPTQVSEQPRLSKYKTKMASEKNICAKNGVQYLTDMDAEKNIAPADDDDFADDYEEAPRVRYTTRMSSFGNIAKRG